MPDKHGEVWAREMHGRNIVRFDPRTERRRVYEMLEQFAHDRRRWIDNRRIPFPCGISMAADAGFTFTVNVLGEV